MAHFGSGGTSILSGCPQNPGHFSEVTPSFLTLDDPDHHRLSEEAQEDAVRHEPPAPRRKSRSLGSTGTSAARCTAGRNGKKAVCGGTERETAAELLVRDLFIATAVGVDPSLSGAAETPATASTCRETLAASIDRHTSSNCTGVSPTFDAPRSKAGEGSGTRSGCGDDDGGHGQRWERNAGARRRVCPPIVYGGSKSVVPCDDLCMHIHHR